MFDFNDMRNTIEPRASFKYWFTRDTDDNNDWQITSEPSCDESLWVECRYSELSDQSQAIVDSVEADFLRFKESRPEYFFGVAVKPIQGNLPENALLYDRLLAGAVLVKEGSDEVIPRIERCLKWLHGSDFYSAPASARYHDSFAGGLVYHHLLVLNRTYDLLHTDSFSMVNICDGTIVALTHDWSKIYLYELYMRNVKDEVTKKWNEVPEYRFRDDSTVPLDFLECKKNGHGGGSVEIARNFLKLTSSMRLAVHWHMGRWDVSDDGLNDLQWANRNQPMVHLIQFADQLAITNY